MNTPLKKVYPKTAVISIALAAARSVFHIALNISHAFICRKKYIYIYILADLGALRAPLPAGAPDRWSQINPNFAQAQTSNKPKVRTNLNFEQTQTSNKPESLWP